MIQKFGPLDRLDHIEDRLNVLRGLSNDVVNDGNKPIGLGIYTVANDALRDLEKVRKWIEQQRESAS